MAEITSKMNKTQLLDRLRANRDGHREAYDKAWDGYCKATRAELEEKLERIKKGHRIDPNIGCYPPDDHTGDYDDVIEMLEMDVNDTTELTQAQFRCYFKDNWGWKQNWITSNTAYIQASGR